MRKLILAGLATCLATAPAAALITVSSVDGSAPFGAPANFYNFDAPNPGIYSGSIYIDSISKVRAQPAGSTGGFGAVGPANDQSSAILNLSSFDGINTVTFLWGSVDRYNTLDILGAGTPPVTLMSFSGGDQGIAPANGNQTAANTNRLVTLTFTGADRFAVTGLRFRSTGNAFEYDNVNVNAVPEPASWAMMVGGFAALGGALRRRRSTTQFA